MEALRAGRDGWPAFLCITKALFFFPFFLTSLCIKHEFIHSFVHAFVHPFLHSFVYSPSVISLSQSVDLEAILRTLVLRNTAWMGHQSITGHHVHTFAYSFPHRKLVHLHAYFLGCEPKLEILEETNVGEHVKLHSVSNPSSG